MDFVNRFGKWALVTGASSGIGEAFARKLAERKVNLVLVARREDRLNTLATQLQAQHQIEVRVVALDLTRDDFLPELIAQTDELEIGLLVNSAGELQAGHFLDHNLHAELKQLELNIRATVILTHYYGQKMRERKRGGIICLASIVGFAGVPSMASYSASKAYALTFAEGISRELRKDGVAVLALSPGPTSTEIWPKGATPSMLQRPDIVAEIALRKLGKRTTVVTGLLNKLIIFSLRFAPRWVNSMIFEKVVGGMFKNVEKPQPAEVGKS